VRLGGTVRAFTREVMTLVEERMRAIAENVARGFGGSASLDFRVITTPLVNDVAETEALADAAADLARPSATSRP
jgi:hippurate hydrolase